MQQLWRMRELRIIPNLIPTPCHNIRVVLLVHNVTYEICDVYDDKVFKTFEVENILRLNSYPCHKFEQHRSLGRDSLGQCISDQLKWQHQEPDKMNNL